MSSAHDAQPLGDWTPPHDILAEQSVLGGMLMSKDAISDVSEQLKSHDFYRPAHQTIYEAVLGIYMKGEPVDAVTVVGALGVSGDLMRIGGAPYVHELLQAVPTAANAGYYARIVAEKAMSRRLLMAGTRIQQLATGPGDPTEVVIQAMAEMDKVNESRANTGYSTSEQLMGPTLDRIEELGQNSGQIVGVPTGFADLDDLTAGLHGGQLIVVAARPGVGKALALDTQLATPTGRTTMGEVRIGDKLVGADGVPTAVVDATAVMHDRPCYQVVFSDGARVVADAEHQWEADGAVVRTADIADLIASGRALRLPDDRMPGRPSAARRIVGADRCPSVPVRCVQVDAADSLYLAGPTDVPTHNSTLGLDFVRSCSIHHDLPSITFSLEMGGHEIMQRLLSAEARVPLANLRSGQMTDEDWTRLANKMPAISGAPLFFDDNPSTNVLDIRSKARQIKQRHGLSLIVVDYLQLMRGATKAESRQQEVAEMSRNLKLVAKELDVAVVAMSQLNRGSENRSDKKPQLSDLRESGAIEQDADMVILLYREDAFDKESVRAGEADFIVAKHRNGPTKTITVTSQLHYSRFFDMAKI